MRDDRDNYTARRIAEEIKQSRRVLEPYINELSRMHAMELSPGPVAIPPAMQELFDQEGSRLEKRVAALQAGCMFSLSAPVPSLMIG